VTFSVNLWPLNMFTGLLVLCASILLILGFLGLSVFKLGRGTRQTDGQINERTDRHRQSFHSAPPMEVLQLKTSAVQSFIEIHLLRFINQPIYLLCEVNNYSTSRYKKSMASSSNKTAILKMKKWCSSKRSCINAWNFTLQFSAKN